MQHLLFVLIIKVLCFASCDVKLEGTSYSRNAKNLEPYIRNFKVLSGNQYARKCLLYVNRSPFTLVTSPEGHLIIHLLNKTGKIVQQQIFSSKHMV